MTAAIAHHEPFAELPSRRLRQESERFLAPALLASAALIAALLIACGAIPTPSARVVIPPNVPPGIELMREWFTPPSGAQAPPGIAITDPHSDVRPIDRVDDTPVVESVPVVDPSAKGPSLDRTGEGAVGPSTDGHGSDGGGTATPEPDVFIWTDEMPNVVSRVTPEYPQLARDAGVEGTVVVWALVGLDGRVEQVRVQKTIPMLDAAALAAVQAWRFTPALSNHHPVRVWVSVPVRFRLHG